MIAGYLFFMTPMCPNCGDMAEYLKTIDLNGRTVDATTDEGLEESQRLGVMGVPTILFIDAKGNEVNRATDIPGIKRILENKSLLNI